MMGEKKKKKEKEKKRCCVCVCVCTSTCVRLAKGWVWKKRANKGASENGWKREKPEQRMLLAHLASGGLSWSISSVLSARSRQKKKEKKTILAVNRKFSQVFGLSSETRGNREREIEIFVVEIDSVSRETMKERGVYKDRFRSGLRACFT